MIAEEWDIAGPVRHDLITAGLDLSFQSILLPFIDAFVVSTAPQNLLDAGCGTGDLTMHIAPHARRVLAVDVSRQSIELARTIHAASNVEYRADSIESLAEIARETFDAIVCNMVLMDTPDLAAVLSSLRSVSRPRARGCFTILHPPFWFETHRQEFPDRDYCDEFSVRMEFQISLAKTTGASCTHFHRTIQKYSESFEATGFTIRQIRELCPPEALKHRYGAEANIARFLGFVVEAL